MPCRESLHTVQPMVSQCARPIRPVTATHEVVFPPVFFPLRQRGQQKSCTRALVTAGNGTVAPYSFSTDRVSRCRTPPTTKRCIRSRPIKSRDSAFLWHGSWLVFGAVAAASHRRQHPRGRNPARQGPQAAVTLRSEWRFDPACARGLHAPGSGGSGACWSTQSSSLGPSLTYQRAGWPPRSVLGTVDSASYTVLTRFRLRF